MEINRNKYYGMIHKGVHTLLKDRMGFSDDDEYRNYLGLTVGKTSCKDMSDEELIEMVKGLRSEGYLNFNNRPGGFGGNRPTDLQWAKLAALSKQKGWKGLQDERLDKFVERTTGIKKARWLTGSKISDVILGLERWISGR
ncbi:regulatory protein GemA [Vibrio campbellii]|nr:regulatory protein GemA [Vibrio campbellii]MCE7729641.1 regulatory protein GemA [Vibrio campbellii]